MHQALRLILGKLRLNRQELAAEDFVSAESSESGGILYVFPAFRTARMGQKIRRPAEADLFRGSLVSGGAEAAFAALGIG